jgi:small subunit ribosomal protein S21
LPNRTLRRNFATRFRKPHTFHLQPNPTQTPNIMIKIEIKEGETLDRALRRYKKKYERLGIMKTVRRRMYFQCKSVRRREEVKTAVRRQRYINDHLM